MIVGTDTLYGNEWIQYSNTYLRLKVAADGIYRANGAQLTAAGLPSGIAGVDLRLYCNGVQVPVYTSTNGTLGDQDFVEFWGQRNRDEVDRFLFTDPQAENVNPWYSMVNDTAVYYLTWNDGSAPKRYTAVTNELSNLPVPTPWCWFTNLQYFTNGYFKRDIGEEIRYSFYNGDGYARGGAASTNLDVVLTEYVSNGPDARVSARMAANRGNHEVRVSANDSLFYTDIFTEFKIVNPTFQVPLSLANGTLKVKIESVADAVDRHALSGLAVRYPRKLNFANSTVATFELDANLAGDYLEITGFTVGNGISVVYDQTNQIRLEGIFEAGILKVKLPASAVSRQIIIASTSVIKPVLTGGKVQFRDLRADNAEYIIVANADLYKDPTAGGANQVQAYSDYRSSTAGGGYKTTVVEIEELYEQFAYGLRFHPISIKNYCHFIKKNWANPQYMLLIGKGLDHNTFRNTTQQSILKDSLFFIPNIGVPSSDILYVTTGNTVQVPLFPIGRLPVKKPLEIVNYLRKIQEHEQDLANPEQSIESKAWHKRALHLNGGRVEDQGTIEYYVNDMTAELQNNSVGAEVVSLFKTSNDPVQLPAFEQVAASVNAGVSTWMFFGHTTPYIMEYDIGLAENYRNKGKYPLMVIMGCFAGQVNNTLPGIGEQFTLAANKGALAYLGTVYYSYTDGLHAYGKRFYEQMGGPQYAQSVGNIMTGTVGSFPPDQFPSLAAALHQMQLIGDPAVHVHQAATPDYVIDRSSVRVSPNPVSIDQGDFKVELDIVNLGKNTTDTLGLQFQLIDAKDSLHLLQVDTIAGPANRQKVQFLLPTKGLSQGFARLLASLDPSMQVDEQPLGAEFNNELLDGNGQKGVEIYLYNNDIQAVYPPDYAIIDTATVALHAASLSLPGQALRYLFELDTVRTFNSPFVQKRQIVQAGGSMQWSPTLITKDSTVYYWRVTRDSLINGNYAWKTRSFTHLAKSPSGWSQSDKGQFRENDLFSIQIDSLNGKWAFSNGLSYAYLRVAYRILEPLIPMSYNAYGQGPVTTFKWGLQGVDKGLVVVQYDPVTGKVLTTDPNHPYSAIPGVGSLFYEFNTSDSLQRIGLMNFLQNELVPNAYIGILSVCRYNDAIGYAPKDWAKDSISYGKNLFEVLESLGARDVRKLANAPGVPYPYGFMFQYGNPNFAPVDTFVTQRDSILEIRRTFPTNWPSGAITAANFGPAKKWQSLHWKTKTPDQGTDEILLTLKGVRANLSDTLLYQLNTPGDVDLSSLSSAEFPFLQLHYETTDTTGRTPTPLDYWRVLYDGYPEGLLLDNSASLWHADTLVEGDTLRASIPFGNISFEGMDSLLVRFRVESDGGVQKQFLQRFGRLPVKGQLNLPISFGTQGLKGAHRLIVDVNPNQDQAELYHFNNILVRKFFVKSDDRNPLLDVFFDGVHILDGDLISPKPQVVITLKDDNRFLALQDTSTFTIALEEPDGAVRQINWNDPQVQFFPADAQNLPKKNLARLEWQPVFTKDGDYKLLVNGRDATGNNSAKLDFAVRFKVITRSTLSNLLNYPNPFSTSTCFVYTMTGAETPTQFKLQIMTVSGKVVREILGAEFGPMQPGTHQSDFCWDGRDTYGDQLANGVYLYRVVAKKADGSDFEFFEQNNIDGFFKHGLGKMVLMR